MAEAPECGGLSSARFGAKIASYSACELWTVETSNAAAAIGIPFFLRIAGPFAVASEGRLPDWDVVCP